MILLFTCLDTLVGNVGYASVFGLDVLLEFASDQVRMDFVGSYAKYPGLKALFHDIGRTCLMDVMYIYCVRFKYV